MSPEQEIEVMATALVRKDGDPNPPTAQDRRDAEAILVALRIQGPGYTLVTLADVLHARTET